MKLLLVTLIVLATSGCHGDAEQNQLPNLDFLIVDDNQNLQIVEDKEALLLQISYEVVLSYPNLAIGPSQTQLLLERGWQECSTGEIGWVMFFDGTTLPERRVHQHLRYWVRGNELLTIALRHFTLASAKPPQSSETVTAEQHVTILHNTYQRLEQVAETLSLNCQ